MQEIQVSLFIIMEWNEEAQIEEAQEQVGPVINMDLFSGLELLRATMETHANFLILMKDEVDQLQTMPNERK